MEIYKSERGDTFTVVHLIRNSYSSIWPDLNQTRLAVCCYNKTILIPNRTALVNNFVRRQMARKNGLDDVQAGSSYVSPPTTQQHRES